MISNVTRGEKKFKQQETPFFLEPALHPKAVLETRLSGIRWVESWGQMLLGGSWAVKEGGQRLVGAADKASWAADHRVGGGASGGNTIQVPYGHCTGQNRFTEWKKIPFQIFSYPSDIIKEEASVGTSLSLWPPDTLLELKFDNGVLT